MVQPVYVVFGFVSMGALLALAVLLARLRARVRRVERNGRDLSRTVATVEGWADKELNGLRGQVTAIHVNQTAGAIGERLAHKRAQPSAEPPRPEEEDRPTLEMVPSYGDDAPSEDEATHVAPRSARLFDDPPTYAPRPAVRSAETCPLHTHPRVERAGRRPQIVHRQRQLLPGLGVSVPANAVDEPDGNRHLCSLRLRAPSAAAGFSRRAGPCSASTGALVRPRRGADSAASSGRLGRLTISEISD